ncbi:WD repeat-containing protein 73 [Armadillidium vulgare]|nr:WD repeat-containing protein 73 [Armadillidium vulgare]
MYYNEEHSDSDDDWIFNSIQKYDDLLMFEFQGKVSSATFLSPEILIATSKNLITYKSCIRRLRHPQICCDGSNLISGTKLNNIKFHCIENGKETQDYSSIFEDPNLLGSNFLSYLNSSCNELIIGCRDTGLLQNFDIRSQKSNSVELNEKNCKWSYSLSYNRRNVCIVNSLGYFYLFDTRNLSKEISKLKFDYDVCEENGIYLRAHFDPSDSFVSISGFDKCVNVFPGNASIDNSPIFCHDGHTKRSHYICGHIWHPTLTNVIFSFDDNGTLQAWKFR